MRLRTPWDEPTTEAVVDLEMIMTKPKHSYIPVMECLVYNRYTGKEAFKLTFFNMTVEQLVSPFDEHGMTELDRALYRRGLTEHFYAMSSSIKESFVALEKTMWR